MPDILDRLIRDLPHFDASARVGIFGDENVEHAQHLAWAEFGTTNGEPQRMTLSTVVDGAKSEWLGAMAKGAGALIDGKIASGRVALDRIGGAMAEAERQALGFNVPPPLAPSTLAGRRRRGIASTRTLVATGDMRAAVSHEAKDGGEGWPK